MTRRPTAGPSAFESRMAPVVCVRERGSGRVSMASMTCYTPKDVLPPQLAAKVRSLLARATRGQRAAPMCP